MNRHFKSLLKILSKLSVKDNARKAHKAVSKKLKKKGWKVKNEYPAPFLRKARLVKGRNGNYVKKNRFIKGRIDIYAKKHGLKIGIEIDCKKPRKKSISKLLSLEKLDYRIVLLRHKSPKLNSEYGIDKILPLKLS